MENAMKLARVLREDLKYDIFEDERESRRRGGSRLDVRLDVRSPQTPCSECAHLKDQLNRLQAASVMHQMVLSAPAAALTPEVIFKDAYQPAKVPSGAGGPSTDTESDNDLLDLRDTLCDEIDDVLGKSGKDVDLNIDLVPVMDILQQDGALPPPPPHLINFLAIVANYNETA
jgi:hypothetical protein